MSCNIPALHKPTTMKRIDPQVKRWVAAAGQSSTRGLLKLRDKLMEWTKPWITGSASSYHQDGHDYEYAQTATELVRVTVQHGQHEELDIVLWTMQDIQQQGSDSGRFHSFHLHGADPLDVFGTAFRAHAAASPHAYSMYQLEHLVRVLISWGFQLKAETLAREHAALVTPYMGHFMDVQREYQSGLSRTKDLLPKELRGLVRLPFLRVGQVKDEVQLLKDISAQYLTSAPKPLVLMLGGITGHGKTETALHLARLMADMPLDDTNYVKIPCASITTDVELFGRSGAYANADKSSQLNAFITSNCGKHAVCILDEFEKLGPDAKTGLLEAFSEAGSFVDKTTQASHAQQTRTVDCSKILFVLTTNIKLSPDATDSTLHTHLTVRLLPEVVSRIDVVRPFRQFLEAEKRAIILHHINGRCHALQHRHGMQPEQEGKLNQWLEESGCAHPSRVPFQHTASPDSNLLQQMVRLLSTDMDNQGVRVLNQRLLFAMNGALLAAYIEGPSSSSAIAGDGSADGKTWHKKRLQLAVMFDMREDAADIVEGMFAMLTLIDSADKR